MKHGKSYRTAFAKVDQAKSYPVADAVRLLKEMPKAKFNEAVDLVVRLGVDPRHADQQVRGAVVLPHGTGKSVRILVFARGDKEKEALAAGADHAGADDFVAKIQEGWLEADVIIATPDMMGTVGKLGRVLGPRGLMPNPKLGTVTLDVGRAVREAKAGKIEYRVDKAGNVHVPVGKAQFSAEQIADNVNALLNELMRAKPAASKGRYMLSAYLSTTMGPSIRLDTTAHTAAATAA
jgi:large subunit ribosomal protein L1